MHLDVEARTMQEFDLNHWVHLVPSLTSSVALESARTLPSGFRDMAGVRLTVALREFPRVNPLQIHLCFTPFLPYFLTYSHTWWNDGHGALRDGSSGLGQAINCKENLNFPHVEFSRINLIKISFSKTGQNYFPWVGMNICHMWNNKWRS